MDESVSKYLAVLARYYSVDPVTVFQIRYDHWLNLTEAADELIRNLKKQQG